MTIIEGLYLNESLVPELLSKLKEEILNKFTTKKNEDNLILIDDDNHFGVNDFTLNKKKNNKMEIENNENNENNNDNH